MIVRLGNIFYWAGCIIAGLIAVFGVFVSIIAPNNNLLVLASMLGAAFAVWILGRSLRYLLAGT